MTFNNINGRHCVLCLLFILYHLTVFSQCDTNLWKHVYWNKRLIVKQKCITITGTVKTIINEPDGDCHIKLRLDKGQDSLMNKKNYSREDSCFVMEIVCVHKPLQPGSSSACKGYLNAVQVPAVGFHIKASGVYVKDNGHLHGWMEIHPVSTIEILTR